MTPSRLSQLAADIVRRANAPRVLDYARPQPRQSILLARLSNEVEVRGGVLCVGLFVLGVLMAVGGLTITTGFRFGFVVADAGLATILVSRVLRALREMDR